MSDPLPPAALDRSDHGGSPGLVLLFAGCLIVIAGVFAFLPRENSGLLVTGLLATLAVVGIVALFAYAVGFLQFAGHASRNDLTKQICDSGLDGLIATDGDAKILYANETYRGFCGTGEQAEIRGVERLFSGDADISEAVYRLAQAARDGKRNTEELRMSPPLSGEDDVGWYRIRVRPLRLAGKRRGTLWSVADITRERERHENIFQELQHAIDFLDHAPAGFFSAGPDGALSYINATLAGWLDYDLAQVGSGGMRLGDIVAGSGAAMLTSLTGAPSEVRTEHIDVDLKRRGGQSLPVRLLHRVAFGSDGQPGASRSLVINRAAGEEPAEDLRAAEVRFARVFNSTPVAIAMIDKSGLIVRSNGAFARLIPEALKAEGGGARTIHAGVLERDHQALNVAIAAASDGRGDTAPVDVALKGKGERSARLFVSPSEETGGTGATVYALDTTEQRTLQENFAQSQKMQAIGQLAGGIAHDFNNVLTAIIGYSDLLLANHRPTDPAFQDIMQIKQNANRAAGLVRQLLAFSRRQTLRPQVLQLGDTLSDLQMLLRRLVGEKVELDLRHGRDLWLVRADVNQFEQVIVNLVVNARDAMPDGGRIVLRTRNLDAADCAALAEPALPPADYVAIEVEDNGSGIPPEVKEKIFEPFFTTKEVGKGTGLGLSMVYGIVQQTGGWVFCDSTVGKGTTFRILLPRHLVAATEEVDEPAKPVAKPAKDLTGSATILLVEDEEAVRAFGARALAARGYTVLEAASGGEALDVVEEVNGKIDLIVSDVVMPGMDGPTMFTELRKRGIAAKVIFVSGYAEDAFAKNLPEDSDFGFLPKPFTLKQLIETVKNATS